MGGSGQHSVPRERSRKLGGTQGEPYVIRIFLEDRRLEQWTKAKNVPLIAMLCLLYTSDAADDYTWV